MDVATIGSVGSRSALDYAGRGASISESDSPFNRIIDKFLREEHQKQVAADQDRDGPGHRQDGKHP